MIKEPRWPIFLSVISVLLMGNLPGGLGWPAVVVVGISGIAAWYAPRFHVILGYVNSGLATVALGYSLWRLVDDLVSRHRSSPVELLTMAALIWTMNILVFATWYWRLDAGGPHHRWKHESYPYENGAFLFPQMTLDHLRNRWHPRFVDYLFLAFNTNTAFSPTDVPVLSRWAKVLMMIQSSISLTTLAVVAARAVNTLQ